MDEQQSSSAPQVSQEHSTQHNTGLAVVAYILFFVPLLTDAKNDPFVKFHVKQGFMVFLLGVASYALMFVFMVLPFLMILTYVLHIAVVVLAIMGILNALHGKQEQLPLIGQYADKFSF